jgi:hypothetical protein
MVLELLQDWNVLQIISLLVEILPVENCMKVRLHNRTPYGV